MTSPPDNIDGTKIEEIERRERDASRHVTDYGFMSAVVAVPMLGDLRWLLSLAKSALAAREASHDDCVPDNGTNVEPIPVSIGSSRGVGEAPQPLQADLARGLIDIEPKLSPAPWRNDGGDDVLDATGKSIINNGDFTAEVCINRTADAEFIILCRNNLPAILAGCRRDAQHAAGREALQSKVDALQRFKDYVHKRLDDAGVTVDPESSHKAEGCRIGGRLDEVFAAAAAREARVERLEAEVETLRRERDEALKQVGDWTIDAGGHGWYVYRPGPNRSGEYLHPDGSIHDNCVDGWFKLRDDAERVIARAALTPPPAEGGKESL